MGKLPSLAYSVTHSTQNALTALYEEAEGNLKTACGPVVFSVPMRKSLARMNGTPQPNQK